MRIKQRFTTIMLTMLMCMVGAKAVADSAVIDGICYNFSGAEATVIRNQENAYSGNVIIPKSVSYNGMTYSVTSIGSYAFSGCSGLTSVTIGNSVTIIDSYVFLGCSGLTSVTIPNSVTSIGDGVFSGCTSLTNVTIPNSVTNIGSSMFYNCVSLTNVSIPNSVTSIGGWAFRGCI